jgi:protein-S-isoprenylcysteine O-methyltransferase Ste14
MALSPTLVRGNRWVPAAFGLIELLLAYLPAYTDRTDFCTVDGDAIRWIGVALFTAGGALRIRPVFVLGRRFVFTIVWSLTYLGLAILGRGGFAAYFSHAPLVALAIVLVVLSGVALFSGGNLSLGEREDRSGLVAIQPGHTLVTRGIYGIIRHPSYLGLLVGSLGWTLAFRSAVGVLLTALLIPPLVARIGAEERLLRTQFGDEYNAYCSRTPRLIPGIY